MTLEWIDPPMNHDDKAHEVAEELRARPGEWARLARNTTDADSDRWGYALHALAGIDARFVRVDADGGHSYKLADTTYTPAHQRRPDLAARETLDQWADTLDKIGELYCHVIETVADLKEQTVDLAGSTSQGRPPPLPGGMRLVLAGPHNLHAPPDDTAHPGVSLRNGAHTSDDDHAHSHPDGHEHSAYGRHAFYGSESASNGSKRRKSSRANYEPCTGHSGTCATGTASH